MLLRELTCAFAGLLYVVLWPAPTFGQDLSWQDYANTGLAAYQDGRYDEAEKSLLAALGQAEASGPQSSHLPVSLGDLALLYTAEGKYGKAEKVYLRVIKVSVKAWGKEHPFIAMFNSRLGDLYSLQGQRSQAETSYRVALAVLEKTRPPAPSRIALLLAKLGDLRREEGFTGDAEKLYRRAIATMQQAGGQEAPEVASTLQRLAHLLLEQRKYAEAEHFYQQTLAILDSSRGGDDPDLCPLLEQYATLLRRTHREAQAVAFESRTKEIRTRFAQSLKFEPNQSVYVQARGILPLPILQNPADLAMAIASNAKEEFRRQGVFLVKDSIAEADFVFLVVPYQPALPRYRYDYQEVGMAVRRADYLDRRFDTAGLRLRAVWSCDTRTPSKRRGDSSEGLVKKFHSDVFGQVKD